jgi:hypothetical protein
MNISVWFDKRLSWCLVGLLPLKVPVPHFNLELHMFVVLCSMLKLEDFSSENYLKTLVIKVSKTSFSKLRVRKKIIYKAKFIFCSTMSVISTMSWARILLSWGF